MQFRIDAAQSLQGIQQQGRCRTQQVGGLTGDDGTVGQFHSCCGIAGLLCAVKGSGHNTARLLGNAHLLHQQFQFEYRVLTTLALLGVAQGGVIAAQDLLTAGVAGGFVINNAVAHHVDAHICGGLVGTLPKDLLKHGNQHREGFHVTVIVDGGLAIGLQMEGIDHIHIAEVGGGSLVSEVHRVVQGQIPDREGLKFGVACLNAPLMLVIELA